MKCADYFWLRSTGFSIDHILHLTPVALIAPLRDFTGLLVRREELSTRLEKQALDCGEDQCKKFLRKLQAKQPLAVSDLPLALRAPLEADLQQWDHLNQLLGEQEADLRQRFTEGCEQTRQKLIDFLSSPQVAEAIFISNPDAAQRMTALIAERHCANDSRKKQKIRLGWSYAQRLCTKNDTCSFFGPIGWGAFSEQQSTRVVVDWQPGNGLKQRRTFFESWLIQRLVEKINQCCPQLSLLPLRLNAGCHLQQDILYYPLEKSRQLTGQVLELLTEIIATPGITTAQLSTPPAGLVESLVASRVLDRGFEIAPGAAEPLEQLLRQMDEACLPAHFICHWQAVFQQAQRLKDQYAGGDLTQRQSSLDALNQLFTDAGVSLQRESGKMYVGRYPIYEDCASESAVTFSRDLQRHLERDFSGLMAIYTWLTRASGALLHEAWLAVYQRQAANHPAGVSLLALLHHLNAQQAVTQHAIQKKLLTMLETAWQPVLASAQGKEVVLDEAVLHGVVERLYLLCPLAGEFSVFGDSFHSPDIMLAAADNHALNRGEFTLVLGETHPAVHTLSQPVAAPFSPFNAEIAQHVSLLMGRSRLILADSPQSYQRSHIDWPLVERYSQLILPGGGGCVAHERRYPIGRAKVIVREGRLWVVDSQNAFDEDLLCVYGSALHRLVFELAHDVVPRHEKRRIRFNQTIYKRQTWVFAQSQWPSPEADDFHAFVGWRCWQQSHSLPRWVFIKCDSEPKPLFIDFDNPLAIDALTTVLKKAQRIQVSEMLPAPDQLWLNDARGRVCCEIRTTFSLPERKAADDAK